MWNYLTSDLDLEILVRVGLTLFVGFILGFEREKHGRAAGLRTMLLVSLSACVVMIISDSFYLESLSAAGSISSWHPDPARLAAGALSGMGFLGAGVIIRQNSHIIRGVTTAATLWFATVIGLAFGCGAMGLGLLASGVAFVVLHILPLVEARMRDDWYSDFSVKIDAGVTALEPILNELKACAINVESLDIQTGHQGREQRVLMHLKYLKSDLVSFPVEVTQRVSKLPGVLETHWHA
jgi:putative Mg2+ transporter-C (MgtC) family protein